MHKLSNESPWQVKLAEGIGNKQEALAIVVIKAGYAIDIETGALTLLTKKPFIEAADQHAGAPLKTALTVANECSPPKLGGEFYIFGAKITPHHENTLAAEATVSLTRANGRTFNKTLRAVGKRQWQGNWITRRISKPTPLSPLALSYENAYGGTDANAKPKEQPTYLANYAGKGYVANANRCSDVELPQLEIAPFIKSPSDRPQPAGFGPLPVFWLPRTKDNETALHNSAPLDQRFPEPWQGGEVLTLTNILSGLPFGKAISITLPRITPDLAIVDRGTEKMLTSVCDTFWIDAQKNQLFLLHRASYPTRLAHTDTGWVIVRDAAETTDNREKA